EQHRPVRAGNGGSTVWHKLRLGAEDLAAAWRHEHLDPMHVVRAVRLARPALQVTVVDRERPDADRSYRRSDSARRPSSCRVAPAGFVALSDVPCRISTGSVMLGNVFLSRSFAQTISPGVRVNCVSCAIRGLAFIRATTSGSTL